jgi:nucleoside-diphosphate-sugar epimerase
MSFAPDDIAEEIKKHVPGFTISYDIDPARQAIAESWPRHMDDSAARQEWHWQPEYDLPVLVKDMIEKLRAI